jgi:hypothetical protein
VFGLAEARPGRAVLHPHGTEPAVEESWAPRADLGGPALVDFLGS